MHPEFLQAVSIFHDFYSTAWKNLIYFGAAVAGLFGIVLPLLMQIFQRGVLKDEKSDLENNISRDIEYKSQEMETNLEERFEFLRVDIENRINDLVSETINSSLGDFKKEVFSEIERVEKEASHTRGGAFHLQGVRQRNNGEYIAALESFVNAASCYLMADDGDMLDSAVQLIEQNLPKVTNKQFLEEEDLKEGAEELISSLRGSKYEGVFRKNINNIEKVLKDERKSETKVLGAEEGGDRQ